MEGGLYKLLAHPCLYRLVQYLLAPGATPVIIHHIKELLTQLPPAGSLLDVGCGPASWLFRVGLRPVGVDLSLPYVREYIRGETIAVVASAEALPFASHSFDGIWSIGLLHHLSNSVASTAIHEFLRVCGSPGYVVILDGVLPHAKWRRPLATMIRRLDRGKFMRSQEEIEALLLDRAGWSVQRFTYSATGLEMLISWHVRR